MKKIKLKMLFPLLFLSSLLVVTGCFETVDKELSDHGTVSKDDGSGTVGDGGSDPDPVDTVLKISTYNVEDFGHNGTVTTDRQAVAAFMADNEIDVLVLQEFPYNEPVDSYFTDDLTGLGVTSSVADADRGSDNIAVYSTYQILTSETIITGTYPDPVTGDSMDLSGLRPILRVSIKLSDTETLWVYGCHLKANGEYASVQKRRAQAYGLEQYIKTNHDEVNDLVVILGDMNTCIDDQDPEYATYGNEGDFDNDGTLGYLTMKDDADGTNDYTAVNYDLGLGVTFPSTIYPNSILDHIVVSPAAWSMYIDDSAVISTLTYSDHYPVTISLDVSD